MWQPDATGGQSAKAAAVFAADGGRQLHGSVPAARCREMETRGQARAAQAPQASAGGVDLGSTWPLATRTGVLALFFLAYALLTPLYVLPHSGGWGVACAVASAVTGAAAFLVHWNKAE
ncbi:hypothetical protein N566_18235 [Streptomycetaceae bacterium MP113-05]|nr:hypothetical protein N566_18235 [Streptomycetaceae bacterium MP113-05]